MDEDLMILEDLLLHWEEFDLPFELSEDEKLDLWIKFLEKLRLET